MKNLVTAALLCTGLVQLGTGCVIVGDDEPPPPPPPPPPASTFDVAWILLGDVTPDNPDDALVEVDCEDVTDSIRVVSDPDPNVDGDEIEDVYDCIDGVGETDPLDPGVYDVWVELRDQSGSTLLAQSDVEVGVALGTDEVVQLDFTFPIDHGTFALRWTVAENGTPASCDTVGATEVSLLSTLVGDANTSFDDVFDCVDGGGESGFTPLGTYTLVTTLLDGGADPGPSDDIPLATSQPREVSLDFGNEVEDLGTFDFDIIQ